MKKFITLALAAAMTLTMGAVAVSADTAPAAGMNATQYSVPSYVGILGEDSYGASVSFDNNHKFDASIDQLLSASTVSDTQEGVAKVEAGNADWYIRKWTGTMTAKAAGTYTLIGRKIDNGFVMKVDGKKVYEYWGASHWFDGQDDRLVSDLGSFTVGTGAVNVEIYFLELSGGDGLEIFATTTPNDANSGSNINDAFTFNLKQETYAIPAVSSLIATGNGANGEGQGGNGAQCNDANAQFDESIDGLLKLMSVKGETTVVDSFGAGVVDAENYIVKYTGVMIPKTSGTYTFGAAKIDNGFHLEIDGKVAYEFWAASIWNDDGTGNTYGSSVELKAGEEYPFTAYFFEQDGGQALELNCKIGDADAVAVGDAFTFATASSKAPETTDVPDGTTKAPDGTTKAPDGTTKAPETTKAPTTGNPNDNAKDPAKTGDSLVYAVLVVAAMAVGTAVVINKKRKIAE